MLQKDDYISRKLRSYLRDHEQTKDVWMLYSFKLDTIVYEDYKIIPNAIEAKALQLALIDWEEYVKDQESL